MNVLNGRSKSKSRVGGDIKSNNIYLTSPESGH